MERGQLKKVFLHILLGLRLVLFVSPFLRAEDTTPFFQFSTINALLEGYYDGELTIGELLQRGNIGLGTFDALNGEMVVINGRCFRITDRGTVEEAREDETTPFAAVAFLSSTERHPLFLIDSLEELTSILDELIDNPNLIHTFHLEGKFETIKARSVGRQTKPYPPLTQVTAHQSVFEYSDISGDIVGFWCPPFFNGLNVSSYHFHFIDKELKRGGHLLDCSFLIGSVILSPCYSIAVRFPRHPEFATINLTGERSEEIERVEK